MFYILLLIVIVLLVVSVMSYNALQTFAQDVREKSSNAQISVSKKMGLINQLIDVE